jgi:hypothetical protein
MAIVLFRFCVVAKVETGRLHSIVLNMAEDD